MPYMQLLHLNATSASELAVLSLILDFVLEVGLQAQCRLM